MLRRSVTTTILIVVSLTVVAAAALWILQQQTRTQFDAQHDLFTRADDIRATLVAISSAQQGYVAPGQLDEPLFERVSELRAQLNTQVDALTPILGAGPAAEHLASLTKSVAALNEADDRIRQNLGLGQELMAADVIYSDGQNVIAAVAQSLRLAQDAQQATFDHAYAQITRTLWMLFGTMALIWAGACAGVAKLLKQQITSVQPAPQAAPETVKATDETVDRSALAAVCTDLSRVADTRQLEALLARCTNVLHASGVMLWMSAGDRLFGALAHGYAPDVLPRLGPISRDAGNSAAEAWRHGRQVVQPAVGDGGAALVTPLFSPAGCIGVLAVELPKGRPVDEDVAAAASVIAAQLSTVVSAWPAASTPQADRTSEARTA